MDISEVNRLVKQFEQTKKFMKQMPGMMGGKKDAVEAVVLEDYSKDFRFNGFH